MILSYYLFLSDVALYFKVTAAGLKVLYTKLIHLTCLAHGLNNATETVLRGEDKHVDRLISNMKIIFAKA